MTKLVLNYKHPYHFKGIKKIKSKFNIQPVFSRPPRDLIMGSWNAETWKCGGWKMLKHGSVKAWKRGMPRREYVEVLKP